MSKIQRAFSGKRAPVPKFIIDLFPNDDCIIHNETEFLDNFRSRIVEIFLLEPNSVEFSSWQFVIFRILQNLETHIQTLRLIKAGGYTDIQGLNTTEKAIEAIISTLNELFRKIVHYNEFLFPYIDDLLELTYNPVIIRNLVILSLMLLAIRHENSLETFSTNFMFLMPFMKLLQHFDWDYGKMASTLTQVFEDKRNSNNIPSSLEELMVAVLKNGKTIIRIAQEELTESLSNKTRFVSKLFEKICQEQGISKEGSKHTYYKTIGEATLASFLLDSELDQKTFASFVIIQGFQGNNVFKITFILIGFFLSALKDEDAPPGLFETALEPDHLQSMKTFKPSLVDVILQKSIELSNIQDVVSEEGKDLVEVLNLYSMGLQCNIKLHKVLVNFIQEANKEPDLINRLFSIDSSKQEGASPEPAIIEVWKIVTGLYKKFYNNINDDKPASVRTLKQIVKESINMLMFNIIFLIGKAVAEMVEDEDDTGRIFRTEYTKSTSFVFQEMATTCESLGWDSNYISINVLSGIFSTFFQLLENTVDFEGDSSAEGQTYLRIHLKLIEKLEGIVKWTFTEEYACFFEEADDPAFTCKILMMAVKFFGWVLRSHRFPSSLHKDYLSHMATFSMIDFITNSKGTHSRPSNRYAHQAQEKIIRCYVTYHLYSQMVTFGGHETEQLVYYSVDRLKQIWQIILDNNLYAKDISEEFCDSYNILKEIIDNGEDSKFYAVLDTNILTVLFNTYLSNLDMSLLVGPESNLKSVIYSVFGHNEDDFQTFMTQTAITLQQYFEALLSEGEAFQNSYKNGTVTNKTFLEMQKRVYNLGSRISLLFNPLVVYDFEDVLNDSGVKSVLSAYIAKLVVSPIGYMLGPEPSLDVLGLLSDFNIQGSFISNILPDYAPIIIELVNLLDEEIQKGKDINIVLKRKLDSQNINDTDLDKFFSETLEDDLKEIHEINTKIYPAVFVSNNEVRGSQSSEEYLPVINNFLSTLAGRLPEITKPLINITYYRLKERLVKGEDLDFTDYKFINDEIFSYCKMAPAGKEYFKAKGVALVNLISTRNQEVTFLYRLSRLVVLHHFIEEIEARNIQGLLGNLEVAEIALELSLNIFFEFSQKVAEYHQTGSAECLSGLEIENKKDDRPQTYRDLGSIYKIIAHIVESQLGEISQIIKLNEGSEDPLCGNTAKKVKDGYLKRVWGILTSSLDNIGSSLLSLGQLVSNNKESISPATVLKAMYSGYETVFNTFVSYEKETEKDDGRQSRKRSGLFKRRPQSIKCPRIRTRNLLETPTETKKVGKKTDDQEPTAINDNKNIVFEEEGIADSGKPPINNNDLQVARDAFEKFLSKFVIFYDSSFPEPTLAPIYHKVLQQFLEKWFLFDDTNNNGTEITITPQKENPFNIKIYQSPTANSLRILSPLLFFVIRFRTANKISNESEHMFFVDALNSLLRKASHLLESLKPEDLRKENHAYIEKDFIDSYVSLVLSLRCVAYNLMAAYIYTNKMLLEFNQTLALLWFAVKKHEEICKVFESARSQTHEVLQGNNLLLLFCFSLKQNESSNAFGLDEEVLSLFIKYSRGSLYILGEIYALQAYDPDKVLAIKLKSLAYLDKTGKSIYKNSQIKTIQRYWPQEILRAWEQNIIVNQPEKEEDPRTICVREEAGMKGRISLNQEDKVVTASVLTYLKQGIDPKAKSFFEMILRSIVSDTLLYISQISKANMDSDATQELQVRIQGQVSCIAILVKNYPETAITILAYELEDKIEVPSEYAEFVPKPAEKETFLSFFVKFMCYFLHFSVTHFLDFLVKKSKTPIFVEYQGEPLLLSSYYELIIFQEIYRTLRETLDSPKTLLKDVYSAGIWAILSQVSVTLLKLPDDENQRNFKLEVTDILNTLCLRGLEVYNMNKQEQKAQENKDHAEEEKLNLKEEEETKVIYVFMARLAELNVAIKARKQLIQHDTQMGHLIYYKKKLQWVKAVLKEQYYIGKYIPVDEDIDVQRLLGEMERGAAIEDGLLNNYSFRTTGINVSIVKDIVKKLLVVKSDDSESDDNDCLFLFPKQLRKELKIGLKRFEPETRDHKEDQPNTEITPCNIVCHYVTETVKMVNGPTLNHFKLKNPTPGSKPTLFLYGDYESSKMVEEEVPPLQKFHVFVKKVITSPPEKEKIKPIILDTIQEINVEEETKESKQEYEQEQKMEVEASLSPPFPDVQAPQNETALEQVQRAVEELQQSAVNPNQELISAENIFKVVRENKGRIKLLVQQQHEKFLMDKLEAVLRKQVNIRYMMSLRIDKDNLAFFNEQSELDKQLILILANKDFIEGLNQELQEQAKSLRKTFYDKECEKRNEDNEEEEEDPQEDDYQSEEEKVEENNNGAPNEQNQAQVQAQRDEENDYEEKEGGTEGNREVHNNKDEEVKVEEGEAEVKKNEIEEERKENGQALEPANLESESSVEQQGQNMEESKQPGEIREDSGAMQVENQEQYCFSEPMTDYNQMNNQEEEKDDFVIETRNEEQVSPSRLIRLHRTSSSSSDSSIFSVPESRPLTRLRTRQASPSSPSSSSSSASEEQARYRDRNAENDHDAYCYFNEINEYNSEESDCEETAEMTDYKDFIYVFNDIEKALKNSRFIPRPMEMLVEIPTVHPSLEKWLTQAFLLLDYNKRKVIESRGTSYDMNTYSLSCKFLVLSLLDPLKESTALVLFALYLLDYKVTSCPNTVDKDIMKEKLIVFLHQYALRAPSVFFRTFNMQSFSPYLDKEQTANNVGVKFTITELLVKFYVLHIDEKDTVKKFSVQRLIYFLMQVRIIITFDQIPEYIRDLRINGPLPFEGEVENLLFTFLEKSLKPKEKVEATNVYKWLQCLAHLSHYKDRVLHTCDRILTTKIPEEKEVLTKFIQEAKEKIQSNSEPDSSQKANYYADLISEMNLHTPEILKILINIVEPSPENEFDPTSFFQESETFTSLLHDISLCYMEALDMMSKLEHKGYLKPDADFRLQLQGMLDVPIQYYTHLMKLKEAAAENKAHTDMNNPPLLQHIVSEQDAPVIGLQRSYTSLRNEDSNFQEIFPLWMSNCRDMVKKILEVSDARDNILRQLVVKQFPWIMDFSVKEKSLRDAFNKMEREARNEETLLTIRRDHILEDTLKEFEQKSREALLCYIKIDFANELGVDQGGLKKEWLNLLLKEICDPARGLFKLSPNMRTIHPDPLSIIQPGEVNYFKFAGALVGLAIKEKIPIDINFSKSFLKIIMGIQPKLSDLEDIEPELMNSLRWMLTNDVTELAQPFTYELDVYGIKIQQELIENGANIILNESNKELFIEKMYLTKTFKEVEKQIQSFKEGFYQIVPESLIKIFSSSELGILISGRSDIDVQDLIEHLNHGKLSKNSPLVQWFKEIVQDMDQNMLANLLFFITGTSKVPHGGFKEAPITLTKGPNETSNLPIAHTCFSELELPPYETKEKFYEKLLLAISEGKEGFHIA